MKKQNLFIYSLLIMSLLAGCKIPQAIQQRSMLALPESFAESKDSTSIADLKWQTYFSDATLVNLIEIALSNNLDLLQTFQRIEMTKADLRFSEGAMRPYVWAGGSAALRKFGLYTMDGAGNITTEITKGQIVPIHLPDFYVGLQTSWEADIWGKLRNRKKAAMARYLSSVEGKNLVLTSLISEIANNYYELLALDNELDIIKETIQLQQAALNIVSIQKQAGVANELAVKQFEAQVLNSQSLEFEVSQQIVQYENKLNFLLGRFPQTIIRPKSTFAGQIPNQMQVGIPSSLLSNRPDIKQAEYELVASKADLMSARKAFYPSLNIMGTLGFQAFNPKFLFTTPESIAYSIIGSLAGSIINRSAIKAHFNTAQALQIEALYNYQKTILTAYVEVNTEIANIKNLVKIHNLKTKEVEVLAQSIETSSDLFKTGRANYLEVLFSQKNALLAKLELNNVKKRQFNAMINIYKALGGGWK